ncbi:PREDICTED: protein pangolin, isoforms A/H/I/S-like [Wasmannia auropunctata]|uniref:protein pangolin, isoforms A/H/I/S-like n=1 Tax=Wasmannia auropunctata TaxID=64793 RepID=UPI0005EF29B8|nr:PREDICTED: protein pangolin, isoforms A/H/I/S-like [Wasmannia auropunctata]
MLSQPVVYAGGGRGSLTADLFLWWFHREFAVTAMAMHPDGAVLVAESADYLPPEGDCVAADGLVRLFIVPKDCMETRLVVRELRVRLATGILSRARCGVYHDKFPSILGLPEEESDHRLDTYLKRFTLKEAFADLHRAWLSVRSETFARSWTLPRDREDHLLAGCNGAMLPPRIHPVDQEEDRMLLVELQNLAREIGLEVTDNELGSWILDEESALARLVRKKEPDEEHCRVKIEVETDKWSDRNGDEDEDGNDGIEEDDGEDEPTAEEAVGLLSRVLIWMEREPLDPGLLLAVRSMRDTAALMASKMGLAGTHPSGLPFFCPNGDHLTQPPPAHMGIPPYGALDAGKAAAAAGLTRAPMYPFSTSQYAYPMLSPEMTQVASWHTPSMYPISPANAGFRNPYPTSLPITSSSLPSDLYRFSPTGLMPPHPGLSPHAHALASHALVSSAPKADHSTLDHNHRSTIEQKNSTSLSTDNAKAQDTGQQNNQDKKKPHIKKPLNAFMLYMKEMRAKVVAECTLKESAAINQILGRRWHSLSREEQARYYEAARQERHLHQQRYPGWSARDNYGYGSKKKKRKKERSADPTGGNNMKKCRARYGLDQQSQWCKPCRRKKKCIRYMGEGGDGDGEADGEAEDDRSEDNLGSVGEAGTPEEDESLSSPGGLSALSSLASPSLVLPSPSSLASPCPCPCPLTPPVPPPPLSNTNQPSVAATTSTTVAAAAAAAAAMAMAGASAVTSAAAQQQQQQPSQPPPQPHRNPVGTNPHDINNPLSVNQLTGQCIKSEPAPSGPSNPAISVT